MTSAPLPASAGSSPALRYHWIRLRAACHPTEDLAKVQAAVAFAAGTDAAITVTDIESHHGGTVRLVDTVLDRSRDVRNVLQRIFDLPGVRAELAASLEARTDEEGVFYVRVDKQQAALQHLVVTRGEDAIQLRLKMEHYPSTRAAALASLAALLAAPRT